MNLEPNEKAKQYLDKVRAFMDAHIYPNEEEMYRQHEALPDRWHVPPLLEELKKKARAAGLWNLFLPECKHGAGLTNLEYAPLCEEMGKVGFRARKCSTARRPIPATWKCIERYGTAEQQKQWLKPLLDGEIRSAFIMTEPDGRLVGRDQHRDRDRARRRPLRHQRPQMVVVGDRRSPLQDRDRDGQDRSEGREAPPAEPDPGAARHAGRSR